MRGPSDGEPVLFIHGTASALLAGSWRTIISAIFMKSVELRTSPSGTTRSLPIYGRMLTYLAADHGRAATSAWDRTSWSVPAGGLGIVEANGRRTGDEAAALAIGEGVLYVGGRFDYVTQADGTATFAPGVVAYDPDANLFEALGAGINRSTTAGHAAQALASVTFDDWLNGCISESRSSN